MCLIGSAEKIFYKLICSLSALTLILGCVELSSHAEAPEKPDSVSGRMSAAYGYKLNDMLFEYGAMKTENPGDELIDISGAEISPGGIVYADLISFDAEKKPYLVIFTSNSDTRSAEVHIWDYDTENLSTKKIAELNKPYSDIPRNCMGEFNIGYNGDKRYISYKEYSDNVLVSSEYYTIIDGEAFMYINTPPNVYDVGVMNFNCAYFHPGVDISNYNQPLSKFFTKLKNTAADSVTREDISERLSLDDEKALEAVLSRAVNYDDFDILRYGSMQEYREALDIKTCSDRFYLITNMYDLGNEIYYVRFSTDRSFYNYTLLRRSSSAEGGYQILKVATDCIPLSDSELYQAAESYSRCTLLFKEAAGDLRLKSTINLLELNIKLPEVNIEKIFDAKIKAPAALIGGGISLALLTILWFILSTDDD